jgi:hypothetical protein
MIQRTLSLFYPVFWLLRDYKSAPFLARIRAAV